uniref:Uncharacterized protein n=1 Tax=Lepeophtheirus salmonis TaxID=72036 RepID=A0A0K2TZQ3_LEPSM
MVSSPLKTLVFDFELKSSISSSKTRVQFESQVQISVMTTIIVLIYERPVISKRPEIYKLFGTIGLIFKVSWNCGTSIP